jgi:hypothetical protein
MNAISLPSGFPPDPGLSLETMIQGILDVGPLEYIAYHGQGREDILRLLVASPHVDRIYVHRPDPNPWLPVTGFDEQEEGPRYEERFPDWFLGKVDFIRPALSREGFHPFGDLYLVDQGGLCEGQDEGRRIETMCPLWVLVTGQAVLKTRPMTYDWVDGNGWILGRRSDPEPARCQRYRCSWRMIQTARKGHATTPESGT